MITWEMEFFWVKRSQQPDWGGGRGRALLRIQEEGRARTGQHKSINLIHVQTSGGCHASYLESSGLEGKEKDAHWPSHFHCHLANQLLPPDTLVHTSHTWVSRLSWAAAYRSLRHSFLLSLSPLCRTGSRNPGDIFDLMSIWKWEVRKENVGREIQEDKHFLLLPYCSSRGR